MDEREINEILDRLKTTFIELGAIELVAAVEREAREAVPQLDVRAELALLLEEAEGILVQAPKMLHVTMSRLEAESLTFVPDRSDLRFRDKYVPNYGDELASDDGDRFVISTDTVAQWAETANAAAEVINELRRQLDVRRG